MDLVSLQEAFMTIRLGVWRRLLLALGLVAAAPLVATPAKAWWGPYPYGYAYVPPVVVAAPPVVYAPPPAVVVRPGAVWVAPHWFGGRFYRGYWR